MTLQSGGCSERGPVRRTNEDAYVTDESLGLLIVADGMGGHAAGEVAATLAVEAVLGFIRRTSTDADHSWPYGIDPTLSFNANRLRTAVHLANRRVFREAEGHDDYTGMGSTIVAVLVFDGSVAVAHVGDSRVYHLSGSHLEQLTIDDSWSAAVLGPPQPGAAPAGVHPMRNVLTNVLGAREETDVHVQDRTIADGERLLLCTDGLHGALDDRAIRRVLSQSDRATPVAEALVRSALAQGSRDNVTALVALVSKE